MRWLISVPVWGDEFTDIFKRTCRPALRQSIDELPDGDQVFTDSYVAPSDGQWFERMSDAHRAALDRAEPGDIVVLLTADMVISANTLTAIRTVMTTGKKLVCCNATRAVLENYEHDPVLLSMSPTLAEWGWFYRHKLMNDCTWPDGRAPDMHRVYFERGMNVVARQLLPHPLAVQIDGRPLKFNPTIDSDLVANFLPNEIHVVTDPKELAVIELSSIAKTAPSRDMNEPAPPVFSAPLSERYHRKAGTPSRRLYDIYTQHELYRWLVSQRIGVVGNNVDCGDDAAVAELL